MQNTTLREVERDEKFFSVGRGGDWEATLHLAPRRARQTPADFQNKKSQEGEAPCLDSMFTL